MNIMLYQLEIPYNTGNIGRSCVLTNTTLHLIKPLGFSLDEKQVKRSHTGAKLPVPNRDQDSSAA